MSLWERYPCPLKGGSERLVSWPKITKLLSGGVEIPTQVCRLWSVWGWRYPPSKQAVRIWHGQTASLLWDAHGTVQWNLETARMTWQLWEDGLRGVRGSNWGVGSLFGGNGEPLWVCEQGSPMAKGGCIWRQMGGDGHLAQEGSWGRGGVEVGGEDREGCHECGSPTRLYSWFCPGIKALRLLFPPSWLMGATPLPGSSKTTLLEKSPSPCYSWILLLGEALLFLASGWCQIWLEVCFLGILNSLVCVTSLTALNHNKLFHIFPQ